VQFFTQIGGATFMALYVFGFTYLAFSLVNSISPIRVSKEVELEGLDVPQFGLPGYSEDEIVNAEPEGAMARA
jgi:ammonia channel protein AmtB